MKSPRHTGRVRSWWSARGALYRVDGPAIESPTGAKSWWRKGNRYRAGNEYLVEVLYDYRGNIAVVEMYVLKDKLIGK